MFCEDISRINMLRVIFVKSVTRWYSLKFQILYKTDD